MATSGEITWNPVLQHIVQQALLNVTEIDENEAAGSPAYYRALTSLNGLVKTLEATGLHVWTEEEYILFPQVAQSKYTLYQAATVGLTRACLADEWILLTLTQAEATGANSITVADSAGVLEDDYIGVILADGTTQWTTASADPSPSDEITLTNVLTGPANNGAFAIAFRTLARRVLKVPAARLLTLQASRPGNYNEVPMTIMARSDYMDQPNKLTQGTPTQWFYSPQRDTGLFYIWPVPALTSWAVRFTGYRPIQDFLDPTNTADMPQEWVLPLIWNLSKELAVSYGVPTETWNRIKEMADNYALLAISYDREDQPIQFGLEQRY